MTTKPVSIPSEALSDFICRALVRVGSPLADAQKVSMLMAQADLQGSDGHGVIRLPPRLPGIQRIWLVNKAAKDDSNFLRQEFR